MILVEWKIEYLLISGYQTFKDSTDEVFLYLEHDPSFYDYKKYIKKILLLKTNITHIFINKEIVWSTNFGWSIDLNTHKFTELLDDKSIYY